MYPDNGCSYETFIIYGMTEMKSLSLFAKFKPHAFVMHEEDWELFENVNFIGGSEEGISDIISKIKAQNVSFSLTSIHVFY